MLHPYFQPIIRRIVAGKMRFRLLSNGTAVTSEVVNFLADSGMCDRIQLSLDGFEKYHDSIRGSGVFRRVLASIEMLSHREIPVTVNVVVCKENLPEILEFAHFLETLPVQSYRLNPRNDHAVDSETIPDRFSLDDLAELIARLDGEVARLPHLSPKSPPLQMLRQLRAPRGAANACSGCSAPHYMFTVLPDGGVVPCSDALDFVVGQIEQSTVMDIWNNDGFQAFRERVQTMEPRNNPECEECPYTYECRRFCPLTDNLYYCRKRLAQKLAERGVRI